VKKNLVIKIVPLILILSLYFIVKPEGLALAGWKTILIFLAAAYLWATEIIDISITALGIILLLLVTNAVPAATALSGFSSSALFLVLIGFMLGLALTASSLDKRLASSILKYSSKEHTITLGVIIMTASLSMIMTNTATTLLMLPILARIVKDTKINKTSLHLCMAFAANIGGAAFLIGTPPNLIAAEALNLSFNQWLIFGFPFAIIMLLLLYLSASLYFKPSPKKIKIIAKKQAPLSTKEKTTAAIILGTILLWITAPLHSLSTVSVGLLGGLFLLLTTYSFSYFYKHTDWGIVFLIAGTISLGNALTQTGAATWMAKTLLTTTGITTPLFIAFGFVIFSMMISQFIQNTAIAAIMTPVLLGVATTLNVSPSAFIIPMAIGVSMSFLLPSATAPNAIVFKAGKIRIKEMASFGIIPTIFALLLLFGLCSILI